MVLSGRQYIPALLVAGLLLAMPVHGEANNARSFLPRLRSTEPAAKETNPASRRPAEPAAQPQLYQGPLVDVRKQEDLQTLVNEAIEKTSKRYLDADQYTPWQIMHGMFALRDNYRLMHKGQLVKGVDFISDGPVFRGEHWFEKTPYGGRAHPFSVPYAFEGHANQFPALLSMTALPPDHQFKVKGGATITMADIVRNAQMTVNSNEEISWTLWFLTQYVNQDSEWKNAQGQNWSMAELVRIQNSDPVYNAPCGGCHGLYAIAFARNSYIKQNGRLGGVWLESDYKLRQHIELARQLQNGDGSFSTNWFKGRGFSTSFEDRIKTSGHMLEWLMMALPQSRLQEDWVRRAVQMVATDLIRSAAEPAECGAMYHALHSLVLYNERMNPEARPSTPDQSQIAKTTKPETSPVSPVTPMPQVASPQVTTPAPTTTATTTPGNTAQPSTMVPATIANSDDSTTIKPLITANPGTNPLATPENNSPKNPVVPAPPGTSNTALPVTTPTSTAPRIHPATTSTNPAEATAGVNSTTPMNRPPLILANPEFTPEPMEPQNPKAGTVTTPPITIPDTSNVPSVPMVPIPPETRPGETVTKTPTINEPMVAVATPQRVASVDAPVVDDRPITPSLAKEPIDPILIEERPNAKPVILESPTAPRRLDGTPTGRPPVKPLAPLING